MTFEQPGSLVVLGTITARPSRSINSNWIIIQEDHAVKMVFILWRYALRLLAFSYTFLVFHSVQLYAAAAQPKVFFHHRSPSHAVVAHSLAVARWCDIRPPSWGVPATVPSLLLPQCTAAQGLSPDAVAECRPVDNNRQHVRFLRLVRRREVLNHRICSQSQWGRAGQLGVARERWVIRRGGTRVRRRCWLQGSNGSHGCWKRLPTCTGFGLQRKARSSLGRAQTQASSVPAVSTRGRSLKCEDDGDSLSCSTKPITAEGRTIPRRDRPVTASHAERLKTHFANAFRKAKLEQSVEDANKQEEYAGGHARYFIVMPLSKDFEPPLGNFSHGHVMHGDKVSLPRSMLSQIMNRKLEIPWQFVLQTVPLKSDRREASNDVVGANGNLKDAAVPDSRQILDDSGAEMQRRQRELLPLSVTCSVLDFRSPKNFIFLPDWMMLYLNVRPRDVIVCEYVQLPEAKSLVLRPRTKEFFDIPSHQAVLEKELRHYSSLTKGATIVLNCGFMDHYLDVVDITVSDSAGKENSVEAASIQDRDVATHILMPPETTRRDSNENSSPNEGSAREQQ